MHTTIEQGLSVYKQELKRYVEWLAPLKKDISCRFNIKISEVNVHSDLSYNDNEKRNEWLTTLVAMEQVLDLTAIEKEKYWQESLAELEKV